MDWVDYKRHVIRYRGVYVCKYRHIHWLWSSCIESYSIFRSSSIEGREEWFCTEKFGWFLYFFAELENMVQGVEYTRVNYEDNEWGMVATAVKTIKKYQKKQVSGNVLEVKVCEWIRMYYPMLYPMRQFKQAILYSVNSLREKNGY